MAKKFNSFYKSPLGSFLKSPLGVRGVPDRYSVYLGATQIPGASQGIIIKYTKQLVELTRSTPVPGSGARYSTMSTHSDGNILVGSGGFSSALRAFFKIDRDDLGEIGSVISGTNYAAIGMCTLSDGVIATLSFRAATPGQPENFLLRFANSDLTSFFGANNYFNVSGVTSSGFQSHLTRDPGDNMYCTFASPIYKIDYATVTPTALVAGSHRNVRCDPSGGFIYNSNLTTGQIEKRSSVDGSLVWTYAATTGRQFGIVADVLPGGDIIVIGRTGINLPVNGCITRITSSGALVWETGSLGVDLFDAKFAPDGMVYACGGQVASSNGPGTIFKLDKITGATLSSVVIGLSASDAATAIAIS